MAAAGLASSFRRDDRRRSVAPACLGQALLDSGLRVGQKHCRYRSLSFFSVFSLLGRIHSAWSSSRDSFAVAAGAYLNDANTLQW